MKLSVEDHHPFRVGDVLLDATGEASFVEAPTQPRLGLYRRTQSWKLRFSDLEYPVMILAREGEPTDLIVDKVRNCGAWTRWTCSRCPVSKSKAKGTG